MLSAPKFCRCPSGDHTAQYVAFFIRPLPIRARIRRIKDNSAQENTGPGIGAGVDTLKELIFHIGTPKTGSSALQVFLAKNRKNLLKQGADYLPIGEIGLGVAGKVSSGNGAFLARSILPAGSSARIEDGRRHIDAFFDAVNASKADIGIVSSELLVGADRGVMSDIIARLGEMSVIPRSFYFIRSQVQVLASGYIQLVKRHGCTELPADYIAREYKRRKSLKHYSYYLIQCELFGQPHVICRTYEAAMEASGGLFGTMLEALSIDSDDLNFETGDVNTSISTRDVCIMLLLNRFHPRMKFSDMVIDNAVQFGSASSGQVHNFLPQELVEEIDQYFANENARMATECFHREELFPPHPSSSEHEHISVNSLSASDLIAFFGGLLVRYDERLAALESKSAKGAAPPGGEAATDVAGVIVSCEEGQSP
jgi:hypothetical protein